MMALAFISSPERCGADFRRPLHDDEAGALKVLHKPPGDDLRHDLVGVVDALPAPVAESVGERGREVGRVGGRELALLQIRRRRV